MLRREQRKGKRDEVRPHTTCTHTTRDTRHTKRDARLAMRDPRCAMRDNRCAMHVTCYTPHGARFSLRA